MNKLIALVGMPGCGKSEASQRFEKSGYIRIRFGDITDEQVKQRGLVLNEENERRVREQLRVEHGMAAYALLNLPRIEAALAKSNVIIDGLYSWEEYKVLKGKFGDSIRIVAIWAAPSARYQRLKGRQIRPLTEAESKARDYSEIENINKGGPISMADYTVPNDSSLNALYARVDELIQSLR